MAHGQVDPPDNPGPTSDRQYVLSIFLDLKKAFDTVDHSILIEKLKYYGCDESVIMWFKSYLSNRRQFTQIDGVNSETGTISCGVPQGSILGPLLFLIYINDLPNIVKFMTLLYADDTTFQISDVRLCNLHNKANRFLITAANWFAANKLTLHPKKTKYMVFTPPEKSSKNVDGYRLYLNGSRLDRIGTGCADKSVKFVGIDIDDKLNWTEHIKATKNKLAKANSQLSRVNNFLPIHIKKMIYNSLFSSVLQYGLVIWGSATQTNLNSLQISQNYAIRDVGSSLRGYHTDQLYNELNILKLTDLYKLQIAKFVYDFINKKVPKSLKETKYLKLNSESATRELSARNGLGFDHEVIRNEKINDLPYMKIPWLWNQFDNDLRKMPSFSTFKINFTLTSLNKYVH